MFPLIIKILTFLIGYTHKVNMCGYYCQSRSFSYNNIKAFDLSTLYVIIPTFKLKDKLREFVQLYFIKTMANKGNNKITELRTILQKESQNS